ncbi:MAG TPA: hypothetical protein VFW79_14415 [Cellulomonas sp.]|uniref:hypothetical protein n=1 Tax=Cellulomonas sp. TaxID=40001 RepID=UPI002E3659F0|nr:hypothetical protein [Cellulomonas sp.]HEX5333830.1 hypothetical protein [Cellulomonas sp.]
MSTDDTTQQLPTSGDEPQDTAHGAPTAPHTEIPGAFHDAATAGSPAAAPAFAPTSHPVDVPAASPAERPRLRVSTAVWGLVIAAIGVGVVALASGAVFDLQLASIALLAVAGAAMLAGSIAAAVRHRGP